PAPAARWRLLRGLRPPAGVLPAGGGVPRLLPARHPDRPLPRARPGARGRRAGVPPVQPAATAVLWPLRRLARAQPPAAGHGGPRRRAAGGRRHLRGPGPALSRGAAGLAGANPLAAL